MPETNSQSFVKQVAQTVISMDGATSDDLAAIFPDKTKAQIIKALRNATDAGLIHLLKPGKSLGRSKGRAPGFYGPQIKHVYMTPAVNSVWGIAAA